MLVLGHFSADHEFNLFVNISGKILDVRTQKSNSLQLDMPMTWSMKRLSTMFTTLGLFGSLQDVGPVRRLYSEAILALLLVTLIYVSNC